MTANPVALVPALSLCFYLSLLALVLAQRGRIRRASLLMLYLSWMAAWSASSVLYRLLEGGAQDYVLPFLVFLGMLVPATFLSFIQACYPTSWSTYTRRFVYATVLVVGFGAVSGVFTHVFSATATPAAWEYVVFSVVYSWFVACNVVVVAYLIVAYRANRDPVERNRIKYLGAALMVTVVGGSTNLVPVLQVLPLDQAINAGAAAIIAFAIVHPRPVNINVVIRRAVTDLTLGLMNAAVILTAAYVATSALDLRLLSPVGLLTILAMAMAAALLAPGMRARLEWRVERLVFSRGVDRRRMLVEFTERTAGVLSLQELMVAVADLCARGIDSSYVVLLLPDERSGRFTPAHASGNLPRGLDGCSVRAESPLLARLASARGPVLAGSLLERPEARGMREEDRQELLPYRECLACLIPGRAGPAGILMAGPKVYGGAFSMEETELLSVAARQASVVLENARLFAEVQRQARTDALTGLPNRTVFTERFEAAVTEARRSNRRAAVLFLDVDRFKTVNDSAGHGAGDELLAALGRRLTETVGERGAVIRFGGDEFVVILRDVREAAEVTALADEILADLRAPFTVGGREIIVTASIGIALHDQRPRTDAEEVLRNADVALYAAKEAGRAQYVVFEQGMALRSRQRLEVETALWTAVEERQFRVYYQPEVSLESGKIVGVEALARWHHPRLGPVSPADFIPIAEENGLITAIDDFVMEEACRQARTWRAAGPNGALVLSVNLSPREIKDPAVVQRVKDVLAATGLDPAGLRLEITENVLMEDTPAVMETLQALKALGVRIAIDDFGSGYSSLGYLHRFPTDALKVDRSFVDELGQNERSLPIIRAVIAASHTLGMRVTAEGVETAEQLARLREVGCDFGQGFLFARPLPSEDVTALLAADLPLVAPGPAFAA